MFLSTKVCCLSLAPLWGLGKQAIPMGACVNALKRTSNGRGPQELKGTGLPSAPQTPPCTASMVVAHETLLPYVLLGLPGQKAGHSQEGSCWKQRLYPKLGKKKKKKSHHLTVLLPITWKSSGSAPSAAPTPFGNTICFWLTESQLQLERDGTYCSSSCLSDTVRVLIFSSITVKKCNFILFFSTVIFFNYEVSIIFFSLESVLFYVVK